MNNNRKTYYIILGCTYLDADEIYITTKYYKKNVNISNSQFEKKLLYNGFKKIGVDDFLFVSCQRVGGWPLTSKKLMVKGFSNNANFVSVPYLAPYGMLNFFKTKALKKRLKKIIKRLSPEFDIHIICSEIHKPYLKAIQMMKKNRPDVFSTLVVPDLPEHMMKSNNVIYRILKKQNVKENYSLISKYIDSFVCLTKPLNDKTNINHKPYLIYEGVIEKKEITYFNTREHKKHCVYIGKVDSLNGIDIIVEASKLLPPNIIIDIYGSGELENELKLLDIPNLVYHGFLNPGNISDVLMNADAVLCPRKPVGEYISYSFPSKLFEYLSYYKKVITYKLPCYFSELDKILFYPKDFSAKELASTIIEVIEKDKNGVNKNLYDSILEKYYAENIISNIIKLKN